MLGCALGFFSAAHLTSHIEVHCPQVLLNRTLGGFKETKMFFPHPRVKVSIVGSLRDREVACSASDRQGSNFEFCVWRTVSSQSSHHPQEVLLAQFSLYVHKGGLKPDSFHLLNRTKFSCHQVISLHLKLELLTRFPASNEDKYSPKIVILCIELFD